MSFVCVPLLRRLPLKVRPSFCSMSSSSREEEGRLHTVFNFGSNSTAQLRARLKNPTLQTYPARVDGWVRVFHKYVTSWAGSSASLCRQSDGVVHGSVAKLTHGEKEILDVYERGCDQVPVDADVTIDSMHSEVEAIAYVIHIPAIHHGLSAPYPSEQYLCAVAGNLREHWPVDVANNITIRAEHEGMVRLKGEWSHPSNFGKHVSSLQGLAVEINLRLNNPWIMPRAAVAFENAAKRHLNATNAMDILSIFMARGAEEISNKFINAEDCDDLFVEPGDLAQALEKVMKSVALTA